MKVTVEQVSEEIEEEVVIRCHAIDDSVQEILKFLESPHQKLLGDIDKDKYLLEPEKVFYIDTVDNKVFIYCEKKVFETRKKLYELEAILGERHFFRASKSMILNVEKIESVRPLIDGRLEAHLLNGERVVISRKYVSVLKTKLGI